MDLEREKDSKKYWLSQFPFIVQTFRMLVKAWRRYQRRWARKKGVWSVAYKEVVLIACFCSRVWPGILEQIFRNLFASTRFYWEIHHLDRWYQRSTGTKGYPQLENQLQQVCWLHWYWNWRVSSTTPISLRGRGWGRAREEEGQVGGCLEGEERGRVGRSLFLLLLQISVQE